MKKLLFTLLFLLIASPVGAKMLWEYGNFSERAELAVDNGIVSDVSEYKGTYNQNISLLDVIENQNLGASTQPAALTTYNLAGSGVSSSATSITLQSLTLPQNDYLIQDADLSDTFYITLEPGSKVRQEITSCTTVTQNSGGTATLSGCTRGLSPITPYTASSTLRFSHAGGSQVIFSDPPQLFNLYPAKANNEAITGLWTYNTYLPTSTLLATTDYQFSTKQYVDNTTNQGAATSTETVAGISELATSAETASSTQFDANNPHVINSENATSTPTYSCDSSGTTGALCVPVAENDGNLNQNWLDLSEDFAFTGDITHSGTATSSGQTIFTATSTYDAVLPTSTINPSNDNDLVRKGYLGWDLGANGQNSYFTVQIPCIEDLITTLAQSTLVENGGYCALESSATSWDMNITLMGKGADNVLQYDDTGVVSMQSRLRAVNGTTGERRWGFGDSGSFDDEMQTDLSTKAVSFGAIGTELFAFAVNGTINTMMPITGHTVTDWNLYEIEWDQTNDTAKFYVNGTLEQTLSTTTPTTAADVFWGAGGTADTEDDAISNIMYRMEL